MYWKKKNVRILYCHFYTVINHGFETLVLDVIIEFDSSFANDFTAMFWVKEEDLSVSYENCF